MFGNLSGFSCLFPSFRPCSFQWEIMGVGWVSAGRGEGVGESCKSDIFF